MICTGHQLLLYKSHKGGRDYCDIQYVWGGEKCTCNFSHKDLALYVT